MCRMAGGHTSGWDRREGLFAGRHDAEGRVGGRASGLDCERVNLRARG